MKDFKDIIYVLRYNSITQYKVDSSSNSIFTYLDIKYKIVISFANGKHNELFFNKYNGAYFIGSGLSVTSLYEVLRYLNKY